MSKDNRNSRVLSPERFWTAFGLPPTATPEGSLITKIPDGYVGFHSEGEEAIEAQRSGLQRIGIPPALWSHTGPNERIAIYALSPQTTYEQLQKALGPKVRVVRAGETIPLPAGDYFKPDAIRVDRLEDLSEMDMIDEGQESEEQLFCPSGPLPVVEDNPLAEYSVRGEGAALAAEAMEVLPLLGHAVLMGQMTLIYGPPNAGKTLVLLALLMDAIKNGRLEGGNLYYVNADDGSQGAAEKVTLLEGVGAHSLLPGHKGFDTDRFEPLLQRLVAERKCKGVVILVDTMKKLVDLMDKSASTRFAKAARAFVQSGGTFIGLAHTNKNPGPNGRHMYAGTADFPQDADACLYLKRVGETPQGDEVMVQFEVFKRRGPNREETYAYLADPEMVHSSRLASVRLVGDQELREAERNAALAEDADIIAAIKDEIDSGTAQRMALAEAVRKRCCMSRQTVLDVLDRHAGGDPSVHLWDFAVRERGAKVYRLHGG